MMGAGLGMGAGMFSTGAAPAPAPEVVVNFATNTEQVNLWTTEVTAVTANATTAPNGTTTADKLYENTNYPYDYPPHDAWAVITKPAVAGAYTYSIYAKAAERNKFTLYVENDVASTNGCNMTFTLSGSGTATVNGTTGNFSALSGTITAQSAGWYRISLTVTSSTETAVKFRVFLSNGFQSNYDGDGSSGLYLWGLQAVAGTLPLTYTPN